jgi:alkylation response protein AidB-like acyl-CoA dehydrogenase
VRRLAAGENPGPEISADKVLLSRAEQAVMDTARVTRLAQMIASDRAIDRTLREEWFYSRATSIFGGAVEVQRDILADRVLNLPRKAAGGR